MASNKAAWLDKAGAQLRVGDAPTLCPGPGEIVIKNSAIAVNTVDWHMQDLGIFVQQWPTILGSDVAGTVHQLGEGVTQFKEGDRVVGHAINLQTGKPEHGAYALYSVVPASKAATLPTSISFKQAVVLPLALDAAAVGMIKYLGLPQPTLSTKSVDKTILVYGGSSAVGSLATQLAVASGVRVIAITSERNAGMVRSNGATDVFDYKDPKLVSKVVTAIGEAAQFLGILDAISTEETIPHDCAILQQLGGGTIATTHPPPENLPENVKAMMIWPVDDITNPIWTDFITPALENGQLNCRPEPRVVGVSGNGLEHLQEALDLNRKGVSATKLVVEI